MKNILEVLEPEQINECVHECLREYSNGLKVGKARNGNKCLRDFYADASLDR